MYIRVATIIRTAVLTAFLGLIPLALPTFLTDSPPSTPAPVASGQTDGSGTLQTSAQIIDGLSSAISRSKRPLPFWALDAANKAVMHWKLRRLSQRTAEIENEVVAVLRIVAEIRDLVEAGRDLSERETHWARQALQALSRRLDDLILRVDAIEQTTRESDARIAKMEAKNRLLAAQNEALRTSNDKLTIHILRDRCGPGRKRGPSGCRSNPE